MKQAMLFAAGLGTRLKPLTDTMPKALVPVAGKALLWHVLTKLKDAGYERVVVNVHHFADQIEQYLAENDFAMHVLVSDERQQLLETGGGLKHAQSLFSDESPILIHNVDILSNVDFGWFTRQHLPDEDAVLLVSRRKTKRYLLFDSAMRLMGWMNTETGEVRSPFPWLREAEFGIGGIADGAPIFPSSRRGQGGGPFFAFAFSGIHSFSPRLFPLMEQFPERFPIMDFYLSTCHRRRIVGCQKADLQLMDVGKICSLAAAEDFLAHET